jgi:cytochrome c551/c552
MQLFLARTWLCVLAIAGAAATAAPREIVLPPETARLKPSTLPGAAVAAEKCSICHSVDYIAFQPPNFTLAQWTGEAAKMQHAYGAPLSDAEVKVIGAYLAVTYGSAHEKDPDVIAASAALDRPASTSAVDAKALLDANGCLACHALDHKVVGPAYHDVAARYASDPQAAGRLVDSIRNGGSGKWGTTPMPPMSQVSEAQAKALVEFILKQ